MQGSGRERKGMKENLYCEERKGMEENRKME